MNDPQSTNYDARNCEVEEHSQVSLKQEWCELNEVVESDFLISPGDIYPNRKVELEDADIKEATTGFLLRHYVNNSMRLSQRTIRTSDALN